MKKKLIKECTVFVITAILAAILILASANIGRSSTFPLPADQKTQILFLGDSNLAYDFEGVSIPIRIMERLDVSVYNCAIGGTTAAKINTENYFDYSFDLFCLYHLVKVMENKDEQSILDFYSEAGVNEQIAIKRTELLADIDYEQLDYVVISYGLNDYTTGRPLRGEDLYDETTYTGALRTAVERIKKMCPNAVIILSSITYCVFYEDGEVVSDGYTKDWGGGYINDYRDAMKEVASAYEYVYFMDNLECLEMNENNYKEYLSDEMHLNAEGQKLYVDYMIEVIEEIEKKEDE